MRLHLSRFISLDPASNLDRMEAEAHAAAQGGADLVVFPESFLHGYTREVDPAVARAAFRRISGDHPTAGFAFGSFTEERRNRMTLWQGGHELASYDKVHLFAPNGEARLWDPGDRYVSVRFGEWTLGLLNCNDLRFPEQARTLRMEGGADLLLAVAWWPWRRDHVISTLLRARAIENACFAAVCTIAASEVPGEAFAGAGNHVFDPLGEPLRSPDDHTYVLDRARFDDVIVDPRQTFMDIRTLARF